MSSVHNVVETVNAAATAIVAAESRVQPSELQKKKWGSCWNLYRCFGSHKHAKRIGHAVFAPDPNPQPAAAPVAENPNRSATVLLPFIAPPSSPAAFVSSDPPSATHSPSAVLSLASLSISAGGTHPAFAVGPYAHETQLVSPPVFSAFTTEPSTAAFTPPPEPVQMTTPSSPDVPFAELLWSSLAKNRRNSEGNYRFSNWERSSTVGSGALTPNGGENQNLDQELGKDDAVVDHRVSFELNDEAIPTCIVRETLPPAPEIASRNPGHDLSAIVEKAFENQKNRTVSFGSSKDFNFNNGKGEELASEKSPIDCEWWTNDTAAKEMGTRNNWTFFPMLQSGIIS